MRNHYFGPVNDSDLDALVEEVPGGRYSWSLWTSDEHELVASGRTLTFEGAMMAAAFAAAHGSF